MPPPQSIVLVDTMAIKAAHDLGCWNGLRSTFKLHSVPKCVEEATRQNKNGAVLVRRTAEDLAADLTLGTVEPLAVTRLTLEVGSHADLNDGEKHLLAYALTLSGTWLLCGPDRGTVRAMHMLSLLPKLVSLESLASTTGQKIKNLPHHFSEGWLSTFRTQLLLESTFP